MAVLFSGRPGIRGPSRMHARAELTENAAIVNTHFFRNPSASSGFTGNSLKISTGRMQPGSRACLRHGPAKAAAIFVGIAGSAPFARSIESARPADLRRICGGFAADLPLPAGRNRGVETARTMLKSRQRSLPPADMPADIPAPGIRPVERRACQGARQRAGYPNTRIRGRRRPPGRHLAQRPKLRRAGAGFALAGFALSSAVRNMSVK